MSKLQWRLAETVLACIVSAGLYALSAVWAADIPAPAQRVEIVATKFEFSIREIRVSKGKPVTIVLTSHDFVHGFAIPDFNIRTDGIPGKTVAITFTPDRAGKFIFLCDNFCGDGHDRMMGFLIVTET